MKHHALALLALTSLALGCGDSGTITGGPTTDGGSTSAELHVVNRSSITIYYLYVSPCAQSTWGPDQLGSRVIPGGGSFTVVNMPPGCYDLRAEASEHVHMATLRGTNFPAGMRMTWTLGG